MAKATVNVSVLFADIAGSSKLYELLGNDHAQRLIVEMLSALSSIAYQHKGETLRIIGDEVMCAFSCADNAVAASVAMHQVVDTFHRRYNVDYGIDGLYIRIGTGSCIRDGQDLFGYAVNLAAKIKSLSKPNQTLLSKSTRNELSMDYKSATRFIGKLPIKGKAQTFDIFEHVWEDDEITLLSQPQNRYALKTVALDIVNGSTVITVDEKHPTASIGRHATNDLILNYPHVSRMHAKIECRLGRFILADTSYNGTHVHISGRGNIYVKNDELQLDGKGLIYPGKEVSSDSQGAVHYAVRSQSKGGKAALDRTGSDKSGNSAI